MIECFFWVLVGLFVYGYVGYPLLISLISKLYPKREYSGFAEGEWPTVSIIISAYNEAENISKKLNTLLHQDYPNDKFNILVANDGSSDATGEKIEQFSDQGVVHLALPRGGKAEALNKSLERATSDIVVFTDADNRWESDTLRQLITPFSDKKVGGVGGHIDVDNNNAQLGMGDRLYRWYEGLVRGGESRIFGAVSVDGAAYAIKRELFTPVPLDVTDDFYISTGVVDKGYKLVFQPKAVVRDEGVEKAKKQYNRRVRVTVRGMTSLWRRKRLMNPLKTGAYAVALFSHKLLRRLAPFFALLLFPINVLLLDTSSFYAFTFAVQALIYLVAIVGICDVQRRLPKVFYLVGFVVLSSFAVAVGVTKFIFGTRYTMWTPQKNR
ncbi:glycosyltransferase family 2 protein [Alkalimarinus coralli]|uniref:glycosyltransferase family 2 protein n=1 Tax=Alkalimarinus coralli TaxID=2935863 RepID=UPI00202B43CF|nr:glycosyltransferase family 2 protein [Alkalimarinus coralli]